MGTYTHPYKVKPKAACKPSAAAAVEGSVGAGEVLLYASARARKNQW